MPIKAYPSRFLYVALGVIVSLSVLGCAPDPTATPLPPTPQPEATVGRLLGPEPPPQGKATRALAAASASPVPTATSKPKAPQRPANPKPGAVAYDFQAQTLDGRQVSLSDFRGKRVMLNFWATWCGPCRFEIPHMIEAYDTYAAQGLEIVAVNLREDPARVKPFVEEAGMDFPILLDTQGRIGAAYFVRAIPTSLFLDEEGVIQFVHQGTLTEEALAGYLEKLMDS